MSRAAILKPSHAITPIIGAMAMMMVPVFSGLIGSGSAHAAPTFQVAQKGDGGGGGRSGGGGGPSAGGGKGGGSAAAIGGGGRSRAMTRGVGAGNSRAVRGEGAGLRRAVEGRRAGPRADGVRVRNRDGVRDGVRGDRRRVDGVVRGRAAGDRGRPWRRGTRYLWAPGVAFYFYDGWYYGDCAWLRRRAEVTGSSYWMRRYRRCRAAS